MIRKLRISTQFDRSHSIMMLTREEHERQIVRNLAAVGASVAVIMRLVPDRYTVEEVRSMVRSKALLLLGAEL